MHFLSHRKKCLLVSVAIYFGFVLPFGLCVFICEFEYSMFVAMLNCFNIRTQNTLLNAYTGAIREIQHLSPVGPLEVDVWIN